MPGFFSTLSKLAASVAKKALADKIKGSMFFKISDILSGGQLSASDFIRGLEIGASVTSQTPGFSPLDAAVISLETEGYNKLADRVADFSNSLNDVAQLISAPLKAVRKVQSDIAGLPMKMLGKDIRKVLADYRPTIKDGRIVGAHSNTFLRLAFLNEYITPRKQSESDGIFAYFRPGVDSTGKELPGSSGLAKEDISNWKMVMAASLASGDRGGIGQALNNAVDDPEMLVKFLNSQKVRADWRKAATVLMSRRRDVVTGLGNELRAGNITYGQYAEAMKNNIRKTNTQLTLIMRGGFGNMNDRSLARMMSAINNQIQKFEDNLVKRLEQDGIKFTNLPTEQRTKGDSGRFKGSLVITNDNFANPETIDADFIKGSDSFVGEAYTRSQDQYRDYVKEWNKEKKAAGQVDLKEVRRLDESKENCEFCLEWADKPAAPGELPGIGDGCYNVVYNGLYCYCTMDTVTDQDEDGE